MNNHLATIKLVLALVAIACGICLLVAFGPVHVVAGLGLIAAGVAAAI